MDFRIADTFTDSLNRLTGDEQKAVKTTAFDLQMNPAQPGMSLHKLDKAKDKHFWSVRVSSDIRLIVHKTSSSLLLCYVDHHNKAYHWAERRKLETHPKTGAAQFVEIRERVQEVVLPAAVAFAEGPVTYAVQRPTSAALFEKVSDEELLGFGVPAEWLPDVRRADEDGLLKLVDHLPAEAAEALVELATGGKPKPRSVPAGTDPFAHPDAGRRFRLMTDVEELKAALDYPWAKWTIFLHPAQREWVERDFNGPALVSGSAGTGKTIVALHRAVFLARKDPEARVLLTTLSDALANALHAGLRRLIASEPRLGERIDVLSLSAVGERLYQAHLGKPKLASDHIIRDYMREAAATAAAHKFSQAFLVGEWLEIVDARQLQTWDEYLAVPRLGRKTRLSDAQRAVLWGIFGAMNQCMDREGLLTPARLFTQLAEKLGKLKQSPYEHVVVDESQDISVAQLRLLVSLGADKTNRLFFAGDLGQRIFQLPFSWLALGVDIRGRSRNLRVNYRTSHQIRMQADRLLGGQISDVDGATEDRKATVSVFNGPAPAIKLFETEKQEIAAVAEWLAERIAEGVLPHEIGLIVRSVELIARAKAVAEQARLSFVVLDDKVQTRNAHASICTMHLAKGLEFRAVIVMACDDEVIPLQSRIESVTDDPDLEEVYNTERHLLYVACTRARDNLLVTAVKPGSEFLGDLGVA